MSTQEVRELIFRELIKKGILLQDSSSQGCIVYPLVEIDHKKTGKQILHIKEANKKWNDGELEGSENERLERASRNVESTWKKVKAFLFQKRYFDLQEQFFHTKPLSKNIMVIHSDMHVERFDKKKVEKTVKELLLKKSLTKEEIAKISGGVRRKICELYKKRVSTQEIREIIYMKLTKMGLQMRNLPYKSASDYSLFRTATQYPLETISGKDIARLFKYIIFLENTKEWHPLF